MASFWSSIDSALSSAANYTGSDKNEFIAGIGNSILSTINNGKATIVTNQGTATINKVTPTMTTSGLGLNVNTNVAADNKTLWYICGSIVVAVVLAVFLPKLIFSKKKKYK